MDKNNIKQKTDREIGFEVLSKDDKSITYKRLIPLKNRSNKEVMEIEMDLPKVKISLFEEDDIIRLKEIGNEIYKSYELDKKNPLMIVFNNIRDFINK